MSSSRDASFDLLGWHLTPSITNDGALHFGAMATKQLRWPPGRPINWPVREKRDNEMVYLTFVHGSARADIR